MAKIVIIGGGAAGMMAAIAASDGGHSVILDCKMNKGTLENELYL